MLLVCFAIATISIVAQVVTSTPSFLLETGSCVIVFDASQGNKGLSGYTGDVYAHAGVITNLSKSSSDWKYVKAAWTENTAACKLKSLGNNKWQFTISPDIRTFYGLPNSTEIVKQLAFVFRNADGSKTGKDVGDKDIFVTVYQPGLNISLANPSTNITLVALSSSMTVSATSSQPATLKLFVNSTQIGSTLSNAASITASHTFSNEGSYYIIAEASNGTSTVRDSAYVCVRPSAVPVATRPAGIKDGINYISGSQVTISLFAKGKSYVYIIGDFNDWKPVNAYQLKKDGDYFWINISGLIPGKEYGFQYFVDGTILCGDPYCEKILDPWNDKYINEKYLVYPDLMPYPTGKTEGVVSVFQTAKTSFGWRELAFSLPVPGKMIIYELHLRDFTNEGTINAAYDKLDYLQKLGINTIELMPIQEFDGNDSWGYNPNFMFAADKAYGTPNDYKRFIDECHVRGIAVILDVVFNHTWGQSPLALLWWDSANSRPSANNPYMFPIAMHPYNVGSDFNHSSTYTRNFFKEVLKYWLTEYKVDGFRFDLSKGFTPETYYTTDVTAWGNYNQGRIDILKDYNQTIKTTNPNACLILEHFADNTEETVLANSGMLLWGNTNNAFSQSAMGFQSNSAFTWLSAASRSWTNPMLVGYMESHDEERTSYRALNYGINEIKTDSVLRMKQLAANAAMFLTAPGPKMIWQFGELGYDVAIDYNGRTGRKPVRWYNFDSPPRRALYDSYSKVLNFRNQYQDLFSGTATWNWQVTDGNWTNGRRAFLSNGSITAIVLANYKGNGPVSVSPEFGKTGTWYELMSDAELSVTNPSMTMVLEAGEFRIYTDVFVNGIGKIKDSEVGVIAYPNPVGDILFLSGKETESMDLMTLNGLKLRTVKVLDGTVDLSNTKEGLYFGKLKHKDGTITTIKICKK